MRKSKYPHGCLTRLRRVRRLAREYMDAGAILEEQHRQDMEFRRIEALKASNERFRIMMVVVVFACALILGGRVLGLW